MNEKLEHELSAHSAQLRLAEERCRSLQERLQVAEEKVISASAREEKLIEEAAKATAAAEAAQSTGDTGAQTKAQIDKSVQDRLTRLELQLEEKSQELARARQREKMNEEHSQKLSGTVDKLLQESKERLEMQLKERMEALEEKNCLIQELDKTRKAAEGAASERSKVAQEVERMRAEIVHMQQFHEEQLATAHAMGEDTEFRQLAPYHSFLQSLSHLGQAAPLTSTLHGCSSPFSSYRICQCFIIQWSRASFSKGRCRH